MRQKKISLSELEKQWIDKIQSGIESLPLEEDESLDQIKNLYGELFLPEAYGL